MILGRWKLKYRKKKKPPTKAKKDKFLCYQQPKKGKS